MLTFACQSQASRVPNCRMPVNRALISFRQDLDVVQSGGFVTVANAFDAGFISGAGGDSGDGPAGGGGGIDAARGETIGGGPLVDELIADEETEARDAVDLVEVAHVDGVPTGRALVA